MARTLRECMSRRLSEVDETILCLYENPFGILTLTLLKLLYAEAIRGRECPAEEERNLLSIGFRRETQDRRGRNGEWLGKAFI